MGYTISCDLTLPEQHPTHYWWPLVFEVLWRHQFTFDSPWEKPHHQGYYLRFTYDADGALMDADPVEAATFRSLWDTIYTASPEGAVSVAPTFWSTSPDLAGWDITCHLEQRRLSLWIHSLGPGGAGMSPDEALAESSTALSRYVALACDLFVTCGVSTAEFNYERYGVVARFATIGAPLALEWWASPSEHEPYEATIDKVALPNGSTLAIVNPFDLFTKGPPIPLDLPR